MVCVHDCVQQQVHAAAWPHIWHPLHALERAQELRFDTSIEGLCLLNTSVQCSALFISLPEKRR